MNPVKVLISDFQFLTREGLKSLIESDPDLSLIGVVEEPENLLRTALELHPDVLVMDYQSGDPVMLSLLKQILELQVTHVLIITNEKDKGKIQTLLDMGIRGVVTKNCSKLEIISAIHSLAQSNRFFCNTILDVVMSRNIEDSFTNCDPTTLSPREYEVLSLITKGKKTAEIADKLHVSVHTVNSHRKNILRKLNMKSPTELIVYAVESGLVKA